MEMSIFFKIKKDEAGDKEQWWRDRERENHCNAMHCQDGGFPQPTTNSISLNLLTDGQEQGDFNCGPSSHPDFIKNYFLLTRMLEVFDRRDKYRKSGLEAPLMGGIGERKRR